MILSYYYDCQYPRVISLGNNNVFKSQTKQGTETRVVESGIQQNKNATQNRLDEVMV